MHSFTPNKIMLYIGGEMPQMEANALEQELLINTTLFNYYHEMLNLWHLASNIIYSQSTLSLPIEALKTFENTAGLLEAIFLWGEER